MIFATYGDEEPGRNTKDAKGTKKTQREISHKEHIKELKNEGLPKARLTYFSDSLFSFFFVLYVASCALCIRRVASDLYIGE